MLATSAKWCEKNARAAAAAAQRKGKETSGNGGGEPTPCCRCGEDHPKHTHCAARNAQCRNGQKIGHFAIGCRSARVNELTASEREASHGGGHFLSEIKTTYIYIADSNTPRTVKLNISDTPVAFKIDTGADSSGMSDETYRKLRRPPQLASNGTAFDSPGGKPDCLGLFTTLTKYRGQRYKFTIHVLTATGLGGPLQKRSCEETHRRWFSRIRRCDHPETVLCFYNCREDDRKCPLVVGDQRAGVGGAYRPAGCGPDHIIPNYTDSNNRSNTAQNKRAGYNTTPITIHVGHVISPLHF